MSTFTQVVNAARKPPAYVILDPNHYVADYPNAPRTPVAVGVFPISEKSIETVIAEAAKEARLYYPDADEDDQLLNKQFEESLIRMAVARGICDANDVTKPFFEQPDDEIEEAWRPDTIRRVWDEIERVTIATSPITNPAEDDDLARLGALLTDGMVGKLSSSQELRARKLCRFLLDELSAAADLFADQES